jgi:hypothetical protein
MRNSQRAVVGLLGALVLLMLVLAIWVRIAAPRAPELSGERASRTYSHANFDGLEIIGQWQVTIERGDSWRVAVDAPVETLDNLRVEQRGDGLELAVDGDRWFGGFGRDNDGPKATITMPALESITLSGASNLSLAGFDADHLSIVSSGASQLRATASRFDTLSLEMSGAGNVDFDEIQVTNADVSVSGAANVRLNMAGGRLTGEMSGAGNLAYRGTVSEQSVQTSGFVNVRRAN